MHLAYDTYRVEWQLKSPFKVLKGPDAETPYRFTQNSYTTSAQVRSVTLCHHQSAYYTNRKPVDRIS